MLSKSHNHEVTETLAEISIMINENKPTFTIFANSGGCPQNQLDGAHFYEYLSKNGYAYTSHFQDADVVIVNSCAYRKEKEDQSYQAVIDISKTIKKGGRIFLSGCLPKIAPQRTSSFENSISVIPASNLKQIEEIIDPQFSSWDEIEPNMIPRHVLKFVKPFRSLLNRGLNICRHALPFPAVQHFDHLFMYDHSPKSFFIRTAKGCLGNCTYCAIRFSRGRLVSKPLGKILQEVKRSQCLGKKEIVLTATDLAAYGQDIGLNFADLLTKVLAISDDQYLSLFYANPLWMIRQWERLQPAFKSGRIHFIHISLNGGSERVLLNMNRGYSLAEFEKLVRAIKQTSPQTVLQTQVITGFPGETDQDFDETLHFFRHNYFHNVQVHTFDPRPRTKAATMQNQVQIITRKRRRQQLYNITIASKLRYNLKYICKGFAPAYD